jgi:hypothetical protein
VTPASTSIFKEVNASGLLVANSVEVLLVAQPTELPSRDTIKSKMEEVEGFEPPRGLTRLSVFKTDPFSQTWVYLHKNNLIILMKKQKLKWWSLAGSNR